jgi:hypothetical protein
MTMVYHPPSIDFTKDPLVDGFILAVLSILRVAPDRLTEEQRIMFYDHSIKFILEEWTKIQEL